VETELATELATELNVQQVESLGSAGDELVSVSAKPNFRALGKRFGQRTPVVAAAITAADPHLLQQSLALAGRAEIDVDGEVVTVEPDEVVLTETPREGWVVQHDAGESVALDLTLTPELRRLGLARDVVRQIQEARKAAGFAVSDRISVTWQGDGELRDALVEHSAAIASDVLAVSIVEGNISESPAVDDPESGLRLDIALASA
jgi:isoleucyl-tRNA synthetase